MVDNPQEQEVTEWHQLAVEIRSTGEQSDIIVQRVMNEFRSGKHSHKKAWQWPKERQNLLFHSRVLELCRDELIEPPEHSKQIVRNKGKTGRINLVKSETIPTRAQTRIFNEIINDITAGKFKQKKRRTDEEWELLFISEAINRCRIAGVTIPRSFVETLDAIRRGVFGQADVMLQEELV